MKTKLIELISNKLGISYKQVENTLKLHDEGATIPFISRYRKEVTGNLDEVKIELIVKEAEILKELEARKETILKTIKEQNKLTPELKYDIENCYHSVELEDMYLPFKPKRQTKAEIARKRGLEPLAKLLMRQGSEYPEVEARSFFNKEVKKEEDALQGARDIIAEWINENKKVREVVRKMYKYESVITAKVIKGKEEEGIKYKGYFKFSEKLHHSPSHRILAIMRGVNEGVLRLSVGPEKEQAIQLVRNVYVKGKNKMSEQVQMAVEDSCKRLLFPSLENEVVSQAVKKAETEAIVVFTQNLEQLLMAPPLGKKRVLAIDPGYRTGCKVVCLNEQSELLHNETIYPHAPQKQSKQAERKILSLVDAYNIDAIAIGNGTAGRETESLIRRIKFNRDINVFVVSENGASVYSASKIAREEFPKYDVTVRGAVSIGRRLIDPLAELVKIDPKSIGVGQYQHDVNQKELQKSLDRVVERCVNKVGVDLNTASKQLLQYVSGLNTTVAQKIIDYRSENGRFTSRKELKKISRLGDKTFEQAAGFLRISDADYPLDNSAVHPESYYVVEKIAKNMKTEIQKLIGTDNLKEKIKLSDYIDDKIGLLTLNDILEELAKPGRDPRSTIKVFEFDKNVKKIEDIKVGMILPGIITNITNFGAFVDIGIKQNGLVHISELSDDFITNPNDIVSLHQHLNVRVLEVNIDTNRILLSLKQIS